MKAFIILQRTQCNPKILSRRVSQSVQLSARSPTR